MTITITVDSGTLPARVRAWWRRARATAGGLAERVARPHRTAVSNLLHMPLFVGGVGCVDFAAFHLAHGWGWLVLGISLIVLEHVAADE